MNAFNFNRSEKHTAVMLAMPVCAGYWATFNTLDNSIEQDPIIVASLYKGSGN